VYFLKKRVIIEPNKSTGDMKMNKLLVITVANVNGFGILTSDKNGAAISNANGSVVQQEVEFQTEHLADVAYNRIKENNEIVVRDILVSVTHVIKLY
jgi:hypothetical protein